MRGFGLIGLFVVVVLGQEKAPYAPNPEMLFRTELGNQVLRFLNDYYDDMGPTRLVDVQGKETSDEDIENGVYPGQVVFTALNRRGILLCHVDVNFYRDGREHKIATRPACSIVDTKEEQASANAPDENDDGITVEDVE